MGKRLSGSVYDRLAARLRIDPTTGCIEYTGYRRSDGYGLISNGLRPETTHRVAWRGKRGAIPAGMFVCHHCDNPPCCNVEHLFLGSPKDNIDDMFAKGRQPIPVIRVGEDHPRALVTNEIAALIRADPRILRLVAADYGISVSVACRIRRGDTYPEVPA